MRVNNSACSPASAARSPSVRSGSLAKVCGSANAHRQTIRSRREIGREWYGTALKSSVPDAITARASDLIERHVDLRHTLSPVIQYMNEEKVVSVDRVRANTHAIQGDGQRVAGSNRGRFQVITEQVNGLAKIRV
ncbi:MAG: hypothetical protein RMJ55_05315 [Roseiflexaceae bacterium]|nr:hypothetical protein [Roseiflexaceae bacterium]